MLVLYRENGALYAKSKLDLRFPVEYRGEIYQQNINETYQDIDLIEGLLKLNARVLIELDGKFIKPDLYWLGMTLAKKEYEIVEGLPTSGEPMVMEALSADEEVEVEPVSTVDESDEAIDEDETEDGGQEKDNQGKNRKKRNNNKEGDK